MPGINTARQGCAAWRTKEGCTVKKLIAALAVAALAAGILAGILAVGNHGLRIRTEDLAGQADQLDGQLAAASANLEKVREFLAETLAAKEKLTAQLDATMVERDTALAAQAAQVRRNAELEALNGELTAQMELLAAGSAEEKAALEASVAQLTGEREDYKSQAEAARQALSSLTGEWNQAQAELTAASARNEALDRQRRDLEDQLSAAQAEIAALTARAGGQAEAITSLNIIKDQHAAELAEKEELISELTAARDQAQVELTEKENQITALTAAQEQAQAELTDKSKQIYTLTAARDQVQVELTEKENQIAALTAAQDQAQAELTEKENQITALTAAQEQAQAELTEKENQIAALTAAQEQAQSELTEKENQIAALTAAQEQAQAEMAEKDRRIAALTEAAESTGDTGKAWVVVRSCDEYGAAIAPDQSMALEEGVHRVYPQDHPDLAGYTLMSSPYQEVTVAGGAASPAVITFLYCPAAAPSEAAMGWGTVISDGGRVNLRSGPGTGYTRLALLPAGTNVEILGRITNGEGQWYYVTWNGTRGYILGTFLTVSMD